MTFGNYLKKLNRVCPVYFLLNMSDYLWIRRNFMFVPNDYCSDILYLNKQRLLAMEELEMVRNERSSLLDRIEQLEIKKQTTSRKGSQLLVKILKFAVSELASIMLSLISVLRCLVAFVHFQSCVTE